MCPERLEERLEIGEWRGHQAGHHLLAGAGCLPGLRCVVPHVVGVDEATAVGGERPDEVGARGDRTQHVTGPPVVTDEIDLLPRSTDPFQLADEPVAVGGHVADPAVGRGCAEPGRRQQHDVVDSAIAQFVGEKRPDRVDLGIAVHEDLRRHECCVARSRSPRIVVPRIVVLGDDRVRCPSMELSDNSRLARRFASALEPVVGQVYFSPECHAGYVALGFAPSPGDAEGVALPDGPSYFASRGSVLGQVPGEVIAAAFGVFSPAIVVPLVADAWQRTDAATIREARAEGAVGQLRRLLGDAPDGVERAVELLATASAVLPIAGRPLAAGIRSLDVPDDPLAAAWHHGDFLREYRGDSHNAAWVSAGLTATQIGLLTELYWGLRMRSYSRSRGWTVDEFDEAEAGLRCRGLLDGDGLSGDGRRLREEIEVATDTQMAPALDALGDGAPELCAILEPWGVLVRSGLGYLQAGPHDLAAR
jgi:hypothetical protein